MNGFRPEGYGPVFAELLKLDPLPELGPGKPNASVQPQLAALDHTSFPSSVCDRAAADACLSGMWLLFDFLYQSHEISQGLHTREGSYWHAIMHRREPDAWNSKYWFRKVGRHPIYQAISPNWNADAFVDRCEAARGTGSSEEQKCRELQLREWRLLFDWCYRMALGTQ